MEITLSPELLRFVEDKVKAGQFPSASDVITGALNLLREEERLTEQDITELREEVRIGLDQLDAGQGAEWDVEDTKARLKASLDRAKRAS